MLARHAELAALRSTCSRAQVGAVISLDGRILVTGYNGAPAGMAHCMHQSFTPGDFEEIPSWLIKLQVEHRRRGTFEWAVTSGYTYWWDGRTLVRQGRDMEPPGCSIAVHAEANAVAFAAKHGIAVQGADLHTTLSPCLDCAKLLVNCGLKTVHCGQLYRKEEGITLLKDAGVEVLTPLTGELVELS